MLFTMSDYSDAQNLLLQNEGSGDVVVIRNL